MISRIYTLSLWVFMHNICLNNNSGKSSTPIPRKNSANKNFLITDYFPQSPMSSFVGFVFYIKVKWASCLPSDRINKKIAVFSLSLLHITSTTQWQFIYLSKNVSAQGVEIIAYAYLFDCKEAMMRMRMV